VLDKCFQATSNPYFCVELALQKENNLKLGALNLKPVEHHLTIPEKNLPTPFRKNSYHYTLVLTDEQDQFKVHIYFDRLDRITLEPSLFQVGSDMALKNQKLTPEQLTALKQFCMPVIAPFVSKVRAKQEHIIRLLKMQRLNTEETLTEMSKDQVADNTSEQVKLIHKQIATIEKLE